MTRPARLAAAAVSLLAVAALTSCGDDEPSGSPSASVPASSAPAGAGAVVEIKGTEKLVFEPASLSATVGTEFRGKLTQVGSVPHNIEIKDLGVKSADTMTTRDGESKEFSFTPDKAGSFGFVCTIHPATMKGTVTVS